MADGITLHDTGAVTGSLRGTGLEGLIASLGKFSEKIQRAVAKAQLKSSEQIMAESREMVPVATGFLRGTAFVPLPTVSGGKVETVFGYNAAYAGAIHQGFRRPNTILRVGKTGGISPSGRTYPAGTWAAHGEPFFLKVPFDRHIKAGKYNANLRIEFKRALKETIARKHS